MLSAALFLASTIVSAGRDLNDLTSPAAKTIRKVPGVSKVLVLGAKTMPVHRIIHLLDWHHVPEELFVLDVQQQAGGKLSADKLSELYVQHLKDVDAVQREQMAILRTLIRGHGLKTVFIEGVSDTSMLLFDARVAAFKDLKLGDKLPLKAQELLLGLGAAGRLLIEGEKLRVLSAEDDDLLEAAKPVTKDGKIAFDQAKIEKREDEMVRRMLARDQVAVIICGGSHDFADNLKRQGKGWQYLRVGTKEYLKIGK